MLDFSLFVTFFPHLVAGPLYVRRNWFLNLKRRAGLHKNIAEWFISPSLGLFMKVVLADSMLSDSADKVLARRKHCNHST